MTGQEFLKITENRIFRKTVMDTIINEFTPDPNQFKITDAFLPIKNVSQEEMIGLIKAGAFGKTNPVAPGGDHIRIGMPTFKYVEGHVGYWREAIRFDEETLMKVKNPEKPDQLWGEGLVTSALNVLDIRLNNLIEYLSAQVVGQNGYSVARNGVNYTFEARIPSKYRIYLGAVAPSGYSLAPWIAAPNNNRLWSDLDNSLPLQDLREAVRVAARSGMNVTEIWMNSRVAGYIEDNKANVRDFVVNNPELAGKMLTAPNIIKAITGLKGLTPVIDDRVYLEETTLRTAASANDTVLNVVDTYGFEVGDTITLRSKDGFAEEDAVISNVSAANRTITVSSGISNAYAVDDRVTAAKHFFPDDQVWLRAEVAVRSPRALWISTPSLYKTAGSLTNPQPGKYTWTTFHKEVPYWIEVGAGIHGGPQVFASGGWLVLKVV